VPVGPTATEIANVQALRLSYQQDIDAVQAEIAVLNGTLSVKQYYLSVANAYGDSLRAGVLNGEIATINSDIARKQAYVVAVQNQLNALPNY
jgi:hypothetical protein